MPGIVGLFGWKGNPPKVGFRALNILQRMQQFALSRWKSELTLVSGESYAAAILAQACCTGS
jgi:hypothetical protein